MRDMIQLRVRDNVAQVVVDGKMYSTACQEYVDIKLNKQDEGCNGDCENCTIELPEMLKEQAD